MKNGSKVCPAADVITIAVTCLSFPDVRIRSPMDLFLVLFVKAHVSEWTRLWYGTLLLGDHWISIQEIGVRSNTIDAKRQPLE